MTVTDFDVGGALERVRPHVMMTPLRRAPSLSALTGCEVYLKLECVQHTGSFKLRGAMNKLLRLDPATRARGVVAASSGNHGAGVAYGAAALGVAAHVFVPNYTDPARVDTIKALGATVARFGDDCDLTEAHARAYAAQHDMAYVSPYNDVDVVAGQGTLALEIVQQLGDVAAVFASVGGGGLIGGIGAALHDHPADVVGCSPTNSAVMHHSVAAGRVLTLESLPTWSDSTAGGVELDTVTFAACQRFVADWVLVDEPAIVDAMKTVITRERLLIEGAAGVAVAGLVARADAYRGRKLVAVLCGSNLSPSALARLFEGDT